MPQVCSKRRPMLRQSMNLPEPVIMTISAFDPLA